jgi:hypothetical protein
MVSLRQLLTDTRAERTGSPYTLYLGSSARIARLHAEHIRLCLNSFALQAAPEADGATAACLKKGLMAAQSTIQTHFDSSQTDLALSFATDVSILSVSRQGHITMLEELDANGQYLTITLAQAAVFLIRLARSPQAVQTVVSLDASVVVHYLKMAVDVLEGADLSETRLSTFLGRTIRDIARAGGIKGLGATPTPAGSAPGSSSGQVPLDAHVGPSDQAAPLGPMGLQDLSGFELDPFLGFENHFNLDSLLGLPGDGGSTGNMMGDGMSSGFAFSMDQNWNQLPASGMMGEFEFGIGGSSGLGWMGFDSGQADAGMGVPGQTFDRQS